MKTVDDFLNRITMYRLVLYGLWTLAVLSILLGFFGVLSYGGMSLLSSVLLLSLVCYGSNYVFAKILNVQINAESAWISGVILFFVLFPLSNVGDVKVFILVGILAMFSKYLLSIGKKHIFNPVAVTLVILGVFGSGLSAWWVGSGVLLIPVAILGCLVLRKVQRFTLFFSFLLISSLSVLISGFLNGFDLYETLQQLFLSGPIIFFGTIMLTEPLTTPPGKKMQIVYGAIVGALFGVQFQLGTLYSSPELALVFGNLFSYIVSPRARLTLKLVEKNKLSKDVCEFVWHITNAVSKKFHYKSGQYLEWTLGHNRPDSRGNRRYFTVSSSPTENDLRFGVKFYENPSSFKKKLDSLEIGDVIVASQLAGDFTMPDDPKRKLVFIAGGIGVTPFRSMIKNLLDTKEKRNVIHFFSNRTLKDVVYKDIFDTAEEKLGIKTIYVVNDLDGENIKQNIRVGFINKEMILKEVPDYKERQFYISGPRGMIVAFEDTLKEIGIKKSNIKTDFFPGYV